MFDVVFKERRFRREKKRVSVALNESGGMRRDEEKRKRSGQRIRERQNEPGR